jgi:hypothetical protein
MFGYTYLTNQFSKITTGGICRETQNLGQVPLERSFASLFQLEPVSLSHLHLSNKLIFKNHRRTNPPVKLIILCILGSQLSPEFSHRCMSLGTKFPQQASRSSHQPRGHLKFQGHSQAHHISACGSAPTPE